MSLREGVPRADEVRLRVLLVGVRGDALAFFGRPPLLQLSRLAWVAAHSAG